MSNIFASKNFFQCVNKFNVFTWEKGGGGGRGGEVTAYKNSIIKSGYL